MYELGTTEYDDIAGRVSDDMKSARENLELSAAGFREAKEDLWADGDGDICEKARWFVESYAGMKSDVDSYIEASQDFRSFFWIGHIMEISHIELASILSYVYHYDVGHDSQGEAVCRMCQRKAGTGHGDDCLVPVLLDRLHEFNKEEE